MPYPAVLNFRELFIEICYSDQESLNRYLDL